MLSRERLKVVGSERIGLYTLLRVDRGSLGPGAPGQFFMLEAPGRVLPRPMSLCLAPPGELAFLLRERLDNAHARDVFLGLGRQLCDPLLHLLARGPVEPLPGASGRAGVPLRADRPRDESARRARAR